MPFYPANDTLLFEHAPDGILIADENEKILRVNPAAALHLGYTEAELTGAERKQVALEDARLMSLREARTKHGVGRGQVTMIRADGSTFEAEVETRRLAVGPPTLFYTWFRHSVAKDRPSILTLMWAACLTARRRARGPGPFASIDLSDISAPTAGTRCR